eukprot:GFYU01023769.1.p1 GENE.GFYU01023769.1~~GFYU01023769.1.p1  ORF type:complete len:259 (+),score=74.38 GFYU01023769.1:316-1092(+)
MHNSFNILRRSVNCAKPKDTGASSAARDHRSIRSRSTTRCSVKGARRSSIAEYMGGITYIKELYEAEGSTERSVPVLFDKKTRRIVNNESAVICRMLNTCFGDLATNNIDLVPTELEFNIDLMNAFTYQHINNGSYRAGFSSAQSVYETAFENFFKALDQLEVQLSKSKWLVSNEHMTEADVRLFPTIFRFDHVYYVRFKLNKKMIRDYTHLRRWAKDMWSIDAVKRASNLDHCIRGYFGRTNKFPLIPLGPEFPFGE